MMKLLNGHIFWNKCCKDMKNKNNPKISDFSYRKLHEEISRSLEN